jgi:hypothetical protein
MSVAYLFSNIGVFLINLLVNFLVNPLCYLFIIFALLYRRYRKSWLKVLYALSTAIGVVFILMSAAVTFFDVYVYPILSGPLYPWIYPGLLRSAYLYLFRAV